MKKIKLSKIAAPDKQSVFTDRKKYRVNLGNGIIKLFKNKADAVKFLNEVAKYLTYKMHECNELYISAFTLYRRAWFYFDHDKFNTSNDLATWYKLERQCDFAIQNISEVFILLYKRSEYENGNYFVFNHFYSILDGITKITDAVKFIYAGKSVPQVLYELEILNKRTGYCRRTIENYSVELENSFTETEKVELSIAHIA
jgi:hypothetical protein